MLDTITKGYLALRPADAAHTLARLDSRDTKAIFEVMPQQLAAKVLEHMTPQSASRCLAQRHDGLLKSFRLAVLHNAVQSIASLIPYRRLANGRACAGAYAANPL